MMGLTVPGMGKQAIVDMIYPVGSIYMSTVKITPAAVFGGEWEQIRGKFLLAEGDTHVAGSTGGEENHVLTLNEVPQDHTTLYDYYNRMPIFGTGDKQSVLSRDNPSGGAGPFYGGGQAHNNMPPYLAVYVWKRIA